jgi:hypothetical protein
MKMKIEESKLYNAIAPYLNDSDKKELVRMLSMVRGADLDSTLLSGAFVFSDTPQGRPYWVSLSYRLYAAGSIAGADWARECHNGATR